MSPFLILRLPHLALRNVIDCWNILESYQFSKLSNKCKEIAKYRFRTSPNSVYFTFNGSYYVRLKYRGAKLHEDYYVECIQEGNHSYLPPIYYYEDDTPEKSEILTVICDDPPTDILEEMDNILDIFKCSLDFVSIDTEQISINQIKKIISWMNSIEQESIPRINLRIAIGRELRIFLECYKKQTELVFISGRDNDCLIFKGNVGSFGFQCQSMTASYTDWIRTRGLFQMDFGTGRFEEAFNCRNVNEFFKNWKEGKANSRFDIERHDGTIERIAFKPGSKTHEISISVFQQ